MLPPNKADKPVLSPCGYYLSFILILCNKGSELNGLLILDLSFSQFSIPLSSQVTFRKVMSVGYVVQT